MLEIDYRRWGFLKSKLVYFGEYLPETRGYHCISVLNCYNDIVPVYPYVREQRYTTIIDISRDPEDIFKNIKKSRRKIINHSLKIGFKFKSETVCKERLLLFKDLYNKYIAPKTGSKLYSIKNLLSIAPHLLVHSVAYNDVIVGMRILIKDNYTARGLMAVRAEDKVDPPISYYMNSFLQWHTLLDLHQKGCAIYDMGGINLDESSPTYSITQYKLSYGGAIIPTYYYEAVITKMAAIVIYCINKIRFIFNQYGRKRQD